MSRKTFWFGLIPILLVFIPMLGCGSDPVSDVSPQRTAAFWKELQEVLAPLEPNFHDQKVAADAAKKLNDLLDTAVTVNRPDGRLVHLTQELRFTLLDYAHLIGAHQKLSKLLIAHEANDEEREAFRKSVLLFIKVDKRFYQTQERLAKHRMAMEKQYSLTLSPHKTIRQEFMAGADPAKVLRTNAAN